MQHEQHNQDLIQFQLEGVWVHLAERIRTYLDWKRTQRNARPPEPDQE